MPIGALIVDFVLTIAISVSSGASNIVAYLPGLAPSQVVLALGLLLVVGAISWYGHSARSLFGLMVATFIVAGVVVLTGGAGAEPVAATTGGQAKATPPERRGSAAASKRPSAVRLTAFTPPKNIVGSS